MRRRAGGIPGGLVRPRSGYSGGVTVLPGARVTALQEVADPTRDGWTLRPAAACEMAAHGTHRFTSTLNQLRPVHDVAL